MTARRAMAVGFGGVLAIIAAMAVGNLLGGLVGLVLGEEWPGHATVHIVFGALVFAIALWVGRVRRASLASGWAERGLDAVRLIAFVVSATAVVEGTGAYQQLEMLHNFVYVNAFALLALLLGFLFIAAVGVGRLAKRTAVRA